MEQWWWKTDKRMGLREAANITEGEAAAGASTSRETTVDPPAKKTKCIFPREWLESGNAETVYNAIKELLEEKAVDAEQLVGFGSGVAADLYLAVINPALEAAKDQLQHLLTNDGIRPFCAEAGDNMKQYKGASMTDSDTQRRKVNTVKLDLINNMLEQLQKRFPKEATNMVSDFAALGLHHQIPEELESYGNEKVDFLIETYGSYMALLKETGVSGEIPLWEDKEALQDHSRPS
ncbi:hypothetical protein SKAU_G00121810 [Synaphobranchus kaupii]|uniref:Uncharacterized protein n=1 Tax=Synaphobranchus kaupii TaxID=118154 RepID=A0A9Q1J2L2_SYNKA|nr:hypothetical protein SKAU_G00121810 [Synaphobranchus kaupii]